MSERNPDEVDTRQRIARAALGAFADRGFDGASTREIARRAGVNQGLITYYFRTKETLWREAVTLVFDDARGILENMRARIGSDTSAAAVRDAMRVLVRFFAQRPEIVRFMVEEGKQPSPRMQWLVDTHLARIYESMPFISPEPERRAHEFYMLTGAAALIFAAQHECAHLTGMQADDEAAIERHADLLAAWFSPC